MQFSESVWFFFNKILQYVPKGKRIDILTLVVNVYLVEHIVITYHAGVSAIFMQYIKIRAISIQRGIECLYTYNEQLSRSVTETIFGSTSCDPSNTK